MIDGAALGSVATVILFLPSIWFTVGALAGLWFLLRAFTISWRPEEAGWRMALFASGFGLPPWLVVAPVGESWLGMLMAVVAASALMFVGWSALRAVRRR